MSAAQKVFDRSGFAASTMDAVAVEAGISKGSIYNYFPSKLELFEQVFAQAVAGAEAETASLLADGLAADKKLSTLLDYWFARLGEFQKISKLVLEFWSAAAREQQAGRFSVFFSTMHQHRREQVAEILRQGIAEGCFNGKLNIPVAAALILSILDGVMVQSILPYGMNVDEEFQAALKRAIIAGLVNLAQSNDNLLMRPAESNYGK